MRFSLAETRTFLQQTIPFPVTSETLARLDERIEGWPAGLRLLTLVPRGPRDARDIESRLATFSGSHHHILTYLVADVLATQPLPVRTFLLQTSLLARLNGSLCDALTGRQDSAHMLAHLDQANLFLFPLDDGGQWYRYHALFAEAMRHEARARLGADAWHALYYKASLWYEQHEMMLDAIEAAINGEYFARAADLMEQLSNPQVLPNEYFALVHQADRLPAEELRERPALCLIYAMGLLYREDRRAPATPGRVEHVLRMAERVWREQDYSAGLGEIEALRSSIAWWQADYARSFARARQALDLLAADDLLWRGSCQLALAMAELFAGRTVPAQQMLVEAHLTNEASGNHYAVRAAQFMLGELFLHRGELHLAAQMYQQLFREAEAAQDITDIGAACRELGLLAYEWNKLETAHEAISQALDVVQRYADDENLVYATLALAHLRHVVDPRDEARNRPDLIALTARMQRWPHLLHAIHACRARLALVDGDLHTAQQQIEACAQYSNAAIFLQQEALARLKARLLLAQNEITGALDLLLTWQSETRERGLTRSLLEILVLQALVYRACKEEAQAHNALFQALTLARPEGYQRLFLDEGPVMRELLRAVLPAIHDEQLRAYTRGLLRAFVSEQSESTSGCAVVERGEQELSEPLSPQERRVLRLLAAGRTNPEIAGELVVSINTIKTQVQSIYYKLGVNNRHEARELAHRLQLM